MLVGFSFEKASERQKKFKIINLVVFKNIHRKDTLKFPCSLLMNESKNILQTFTRQVGNFLMF